MKDLKNLFKHAVFLLAIAIAVAGCDNPIEEDEGEGIITLITQGTKVQLAMAGTGTITVDWGDGTDETFTLTSDYYFVSTPGVYYTIAPPKYNYLYVHNYSDNSSYSIKITGENITHFSCAKYLSFSNRITSLDVSKNIKLTVFDCGGNSLTNLNVSKNIRLTELECIGNSLTNLDVSKNIILTKLYCSGNSLTSLDVSKNKRLTELGCGGNSLTSLDVSKNVKLTVFDCSRNSLTSLDVSENTALTKLFCNGTQLTNLDMSKNTLLTELYCVGDWGTDNRLINLDVSKNIKLTRLVCIDNKITSLDVSKSTMLEELMCHNNNLSGDALNNLFKTLHNNTVSEKRITIYNNPGSEECNRSIAESKGWKVY